MDGIETALIILAMFLILAPLMTWVETLEIRAQAAKMEAEARLIEAENRRDRTPPSSADE